MCDDDEISFDVCPGGLNGRITYGTFGPAAHGKFASSTGYYSMAGMFHRYDDEEPAPDPSQALSDEIADNLYQKQVGLCFVVWEEYAEHGWRWSEEIRGRYVIRLPNWIDSPKLITTLEAHGVTQHGKPERLNSYFGIGADEISLPELKKRMAPLLIPGTRFKDQRLLADELRQGIQQSLF